MKKLLILILTILLLAACGGKEESQSPVNTEPIVKQEESDEPTQAELDAKLKAEAVTLDFVAANGNEVAEDTKVTITGEVSNISNGDIVGGEFTITTNENDGLGMYTIKNFSMKEVAKGDTVKVYGTYVGKDNLGMPSITITVIEQQ